MADILPAFPLNLVTFPSGTLNLHIFEPRYKQLVYECHSKSGSFILVPVANNKIADIGTEMTITEVSKVYEDGKMDIKTKGKSRVKILEYYQQQSGKLHPGVEYERLSWNDKHDLIKNEEILSLVEQLFNLVGAKEMDNISPANLHLNSIIHKIGLTTQQEIKLLKMEDAVDRQNFVINYLNNIIPELKIAEEIRYKAQLNGHFRNLIPPF